MNFWSLTVACVVTLSLAEPTWGKEQPPIDFQRDIQPIFRKHCYSCHGPKKQRSGFRLDVKALALKGGELHQPTIVPGKSADSPLIQVIRSADEDVQMPPDGNRLPKETIALLARWVDEGAKWPDGADDTVLADPTKHWSFQPLRKPVIPASDGMWGNNPIDEFILTKLRQAEMQPAPPASRTDLIRRVYFDLIGLPPTVEEVEAFNSNPAPDAYEQLVERLLASPRYGERWAQHWLDVVRYADTHGYEVNTERPNAWPYRDYVIKALNADISYPQFVKDQLAGDQTGAHAATGFLVTSSVLLPGQIGKDAPSIRLARQDALDEIVINASQSFLGLSIGCARCHDHKFDPISQKEYYSMQAFFAGVEYEDREIPPADAKGSTTTRKELEQQLHNILIQRAMLEPAFGTGGRSQINPMLNVERFAPVTTTAVRMVIEKANRLEPCVDELEIFNISGKNAALTSSGGKVTATGSKESPNRHSLKFINDGTYGNSSSWMSHQVGRGEVTCEFPQPETIHRIHWGRDRLGEFQDRLATTYRFEYRDEQGKWHLLCDSTDRKPKVQPKPTPTAGQWHLFERILVKNLDAERKTLEQSLQAVKPQLVFAGQFRKPDDIRFLHRGDPEQPKEQVPPAPPAILGGKPLALDAAESTRRTYLADWIGSNSNPLTARVLVNRLWQGHFGIGIVASSSDFGISGTAPSHPELLEWLAAEFIESGWSIKAMHRLMVLSATYQQSGRILPEYLARDADCRLLWRYPTRRLDAEVIRDAMLAVNGRFNQEMGGSGYNLFDRRGGLTGFKPIESFDYRGRKRMIYAHRVRRERDAVFGAFDCPDFGQSTSQRRESTTPLQALSLFNSQFTIDESKAFAEKVIQQVGDDLNLQITTAYQLALGRKPDTTERALVTPIVQQHGLAVLCRVLYNSNEFLLIP
ncbi:MAG: PSD1 and planctomycete cytochrome C domain-containing protein [Zavarzinella sp.]